MAHILIYLDESGCLGFKNPRASKYFIITLLKLDNLEIQKGVFSAIKKTIKNLSFGLLRPSGARSGVGDRNVCAPSSSLRGAQASKQSKDLITKKTSRYKMFHVNQF